MSSDGPPRKRGGRGASEGEGNAGLFPELLRRGLTLGFTGFFMTEEALRRALGDSAPREMVDFLRDQSERMRNEFLERMSREFGRVLSAMDPVEIAKRLLEGRTVEVSARIRFVDKDDKKDAD